MKVRILCGYIFTAILSTSAIPLHADNPPYSYGVPERASSGPVYAYGNEIPKMFPSPMGNWYSYSAQSEQYKRSKEPTLYMMPGPLVVQTQAQPVIQQVQPEPAQAVRLSQPVVAIFKAETNQTVTVNLTAGQIVVVLKPETIIQVPKVEQKAEIKASPPQVATKQ